MAYPLDANVFIEAKNLYYGFDFCPAFWDWLIAKHEAGAVFSVEKFHDELLPIDDALVEWANARGPSFFRSPTDADSPSALKEGLDGIGLFRAPVVEVVEP